MRIGLNWYVLVPFAILMAFASSAHAQQSNASVVASCGSVTYVAGRLYPLTQDTTGKACGASTGTISGTVTANLGAATKVSTAALAANLVVNAAASNLYSFEVAADSTLAAAPWWVMIYDATSAPGDGSVTPAKCYSLPTGATTLSASFGPAPIAFTTGIVIGVSTNGCFTKAASTHAFISGDYK
jgi:hypothetical protein